MPDTLPWIDTQADVMRDRIARWCAVNSGTANHAGVERVAAEAVAVLSPIADTVERTALPQYTTIDDAGQPRTSRVPDAVLARRRPDAPVQALLVIHLDTVYGPDHPFQTVETIDGGDEGLHFRGRGFRGPGVADAKGGLAVMLTALEAFERAEPARRNPVGWTVLLNPDEEIGSPASIDLLHDEAARAHVGLVYEPAMPNGDLIGQRKGSGNFTVVVRGRSAHAGRDFFQGRNAVVAAAHLATQLAALTDEARGTTVNVARIAGGSANNVVPDLAILRANARVADPDARRDLDAAVAAAVEPLSAGDGLTAELHGTFNNPPKPRTPASDRLFEQLAAAGADVGVRFGLQTSGGVCDGNKLAAAGLPTVDTLGPVGGAIHSDQEYLDLDSLVPRAKLSTALLLGYASGRFEVPERQ